MMMAEASHDIRATTTDTAVSGSKSTASKSVYLVVQRYRSCQILIEEKEWISVGSSFEDALGDDKSDDNSSSSCLHCGMLVYISFAAGSDRKAVEQAAKTLLNLQVLTTGLWGDGVSRTVSVLELAASGSNKSSIVIVPQANLISKVKNQGKSIQYHGQIDKTLGEELYHFFCDCIRGAVLEQQCEMRNESLPKWFNTWKQSLIEASSTTKTATPSPSIPPDQLFRDTSKYSAWDETGMPLKDASGEPLTKSALKKLRKQMDAHRKRHEKWNEKNQGQASVEESKEESTATKDAVQQPDDRWSVLDPSFCHVVAGSFGKRQGLNMRSDMGPFCHVLQV